MRTHFKKRNPRKRCCVCKELSHLEKNYFNRATIEDEKKTKADKIRTQIKQQWVRKSLKSSSKNNEVIDTQINELGDSIIFA